MAIEEHDREDLLNEGNNLPWRGQCKIDDTLVLVGFRDQGQASLFCGSDPVFQFNTSGELRRVYYRKTRYRAEDGRLVALTQPQRGGKVTFLPSPVDSETEAEVLQSLHAWLSAISSMIPSASWQVVGEPGNDFRGRLHAWLHSLPDPPSIAKRPNA